MQKAPAGAGSGPRGPPTLTGVPGLGRAGLSPAALK